MGVELFDIEMPGNKKGVLRVFISSAEEAPGSGISVDNCEALSKRSSSDPSLGEILEEYALEVSSPGVNRRLRRPEHFCQAIGERIKFSVKTEEGEVISFRGVIVACDGITLEVDIEEPSGKVFFPLENVLKARVDYLFN